MVILADIVGPIKKTTKIVTCLMRSVYLNKVRYGKMFFGSARKFKLNVVLTFTIAVVSMWLIWLIRFFLFV